MKFKPYGFSLTELLVTVSILGILTGVAIPYYVKYKEQPVKLAMKTELSELSKFLNYAHSVDGGYHHNIFAMGYKPNKNLMAEAGFAYKRGTKPGCTIYPQTNSGNFSPFLTITKESFDKSKVESSTRASHICKAGYCTKTDKVVTGILSAQSFSSGHTGCQTAFGSKAFECSCDDFIIYSRANVRPGKEAKMFTNQDGAFGYSDTNNHVDLY